MIKNFFGICMFFLSISAFSCNNSLPTDNPDFCSSFKTAATCYCTSSGVPSGMCQNMKVLYNRMVGYFGSLQAACQYQRYTSAQDCMDNWNCYLYGGIDSKGQLCSSTQLPCSN